MAGVPAINGLYTGFFNVIIYVLLGTSKHLSTGTYAIVSLTVGTTVKKYAGILYPRQKLFIRNGTPSHHQQNYSAVGLNSNFLYNSENFISTDPVEGAILVSTCLCFFVGVIQFALGVCHAGVVTKYLSDTIVNGFMCGSAVHVAVRQVSSLLGIELSVEPMKFVVIGVITFFYVNMYILYNFIV